MLALKGHIQELGIYFKDKQQTNTVNQVITKKD